MLLLGFPFLIGSCGVAAGVVQGVIILLPVYNSFLLLCIKKPLADQEVVTVSARLLFRRGLRVSAAPPEWHRLAPVSPLRCISLQC